jgi:dGTPase
LGPADVDAIRAHREPVAGFSPKVGRALQTLRDFLYSRMYNHAKVKGMQRQARRVVRELFAGLLERPGCLPPDWQARAGAPGDARTAEAIGDYIAGMTDRFALDEHDRLLQSTGRTR